MSKLRKNVIFIDNTNENWVGDMNIHSKTVDYIRVPNTSRNIEPKYTKDLAKSGNQYAKYLLESGTSNFVNKGLDLKIANRLKTWSGTPTESVKCVLFDWDGTISASEGFSLEAFDTFLPKYKMEFTSPMMDFLLPRGGTKSSRKTRKRNPSSPNMTLKKMIDLPEYQESLTQSLAMPSKEYLDDMFVYLMRPERVEMLRDLFRTLLSNGVRIHVFTHNPYASTANPYRKIFIELMWRLFNENSEIQHSKTYKDRSCNLVKIYESSSQLVSIISREKLETMLHSTMDYTRPGEPFMKHNMMRGIGLHPTI